ncbi:hypothetical protein HJC23_001452 [Cyclotella cryptica]|uniref:Uncharacterized protein n=1 Tax=Cyclotella cryptica TaxID=29204 RepID=A0ABD3PBB6_9STRA
MEGSLSAKRIAVVTAVVVSVTLNIIAANSLKPATNAPLSVQDATDQILHPNIETNKNSRIAADVNTILHIPSEAKIIVHFGQNRSCSHPQLIGRLSGLFLSKVKWEDRNVVNTNGEYIVVGHYNVPSPGQYFIEIIVTMCTQLDVDVDPTNICMVDPVHHRLTQENATIDADIERAIRDDKSEIGFWFHNMKNRNSTPL